MSPTDLAADGLSGALKVLAAQTRMLFHIDCRFQGDSSITVHDSTAQTSLYRVAQEATHNAIRHGKAKHLHIGLTTKGGNIVLRVHDDGVGLPLKPHKKQGFGLRIMDYRAKALGGSLAVEKPKSGGTTLLCSIPQALTHQRPNTVYERQKVSDQR
jgi:signal transduction histidine kinase